MQTHTEIPNTVLITSIVVLAEEIFDSLPSRQGSAVHHAVEGTYFDFFEARSGYGEQGVPVWIVSPEVAQEVDR